MAKFNQNGQWSLSGDEDSLMFKTGEQRSSGKNDIIERKAIDPNGEEAKAIFDRLAKSILEGAQSNQYRQATNEELFGHLVPSEEQVEKAEKDWEEKFSGWYEEAQKPIEPQKKSAEWGLCKSFKDELTEEELEKYEREEREFNIKSR